jgi:Arc/MetJ-type ribon-helix-helix transcriptional regulator
MPRSLHVRLDDESVVALGILRAAGMNDSEAVRAALQEAAGRRRTRAALRDEVRRLAEDPVDVEEMRLVREQMDELAAWRVDSDDPR